MTEKIKLEPICDKPDMMGSYWPRCQHVIPAPRGEPGPRQCRRAARATTGLCDSHASQAEALKR